MTPDTQRNTSTPHGFANAFKKQKKAKNMTAIYNHHFEAREFSSTMPDIKLMGPRESGHELV